MNKIILSLILVTTMSFTAWSQGSGKVLDYNGSSSYLNCGTINLSNTSLTLMGWVKVDNFKTAHPYITSLFGEEAPSSGHAQVRLGDANLDKEKIQFILYINGRNTKLDGATKLKAGKWHHVAATYDGSNMKIYLDGNLDATMSVSGPVSSNSNFYIGYNYANARIIDGQIDEVSVWKTALSQSTIRTWMCQTIKSSHPNYSNLEAYWKFDKGTGTAVTDHSTKTHTGRFVSSPTWATSSAPIGDTSVADYVLPLALKLIHPNGDSLSVKSVTGATSAHIYRVNQKPNVTTMPSGITTYDTTRYWGVFYPGGGTASGSVSYHYANNAHYQGIGSCMIDLANRNNNAGTSWALTNATQSSSALSKTSQGIKEYILLYRSNKSIHADTAKTICNGDSLKLEHNTSGMNYTWYRNNAVISGASSNSFQAKQAGTYWLTVGLGSCVDTSFRFTLGTQAQPNVTLAPLGTSCPDKQFDTLSGGLPAGGVFQHTFVSGNIFITKNAGPGFHKIIYLYTDTFGCSDTASQILEVFNWPQVSVAGLPSMCADSNAFALSNGTPSGGIYYVNGVSTSSFDAPTYGDGNHKLKYTIVDNNGCMNSDSTTVNIRKLPTVTLALFEKKACEYDNTKILNGHFPAVGGIYSGAGVSGRQLDPAAAGPGKHPISYAYTDPNVRCSNTAVDTFEVVARPTRPVITNISGTLNSTSADKYFWYDLTGRLTSDTLQSYTPTESGDFYIVVRTNGCTSHRSDTITVEVGGPNSIAGYESNSFSIYPNPGQDIIHVEGNSADSEFTVKLINYSGQVISTQTGVGIVEMDIDGLSSGSYILSIETEQGISRYSYVISSNR